MMGRGSSKNYKFGQKNNWRRTIWNEVLSRTAGREKDGPILYLAGSQDLDRAIAVQKGVPDQNLIAIDQNTDNVDRIRAGKHPVIHGDIEDVIGSWPISRPVCAVMLDFCAGFTQPAIDIYDLLERKPFREAVVMINMQRGRDAYSNGLRDSLSPGDRLDGFDYLGAFAACPDIGGGDILTSKHRALQWLVYHSIDAAKTAEPGWIDNLKTFPGYEPGFEDGIMLIFATNYFSSSRPHFYSYKSGVLTFDSVVCTNPARLLNQMADAENSHRNVDENIERQHANQRSIEMGRTIAATLAVRTRRLAQTA